MYRLLFISCLILAPFLMVFVDAQEPAALTLDEAVRLAPEANADVAAARVALASAERELARAEADPLVLRLDKLQARQSVESAQLALQTALFRTHVDTTNAFTAALEADEALDIALMQRDIAAITLEAQQLRLGAGAATQLDVDRARNDYEAAVRGVRDAEIARDHAYADLSSRLGVAAEILAPVEDELADVPPWEEVLADALRQNTQILAGERAVELAQARLETVDNAFSTRTDIQNARENLANAEANLAETRRSLELSLRSTYNAALAALARLESAQATFATSLTELTAQRTRLDAGSISPIAFRQAELSHANTAASLASARHALRLAVLRLEQAITG